VSVIEPALAEVTDNCKTGGRANLSVRRKNEMPGQKAPKHFFHGHENDPPKRVIGLALASILFLRYLSWSFQVERTAVVLSP
jgi:hypothetical protein